MHPSERTIWDYWADHYEGLWAQHFSLRPSRDLVHARLEEVAPERPRILDAGCGVGQFLQELAERRPGAELLGFDTSAAMVARARADHPHPRVTYRHCTLWDIERGDGFDVVTCMHAFPYMPDRYGALVRMRELLRPGGRVLIVQANAETPYDRAFLRFVKLTTTAATYDAAGDIQALMRRAGLRAGVVRPIPRWFFIPSIQLVEGVL